MNTKILKILLALTAISLALICAGCTEEKNKDSGIDASTATDTGKASGPVETQLENDDKSFEIISTVDLSTGEMLNVSGKAWRSENNLTYVELDATNHGDSNVTIAYAVSLFDNGKDPTMKVWDSGNVTITPGDTQTFYLESEPGSEEFFSKTNSPVRFQFSLSTNDGVTQTIIYKGETSIPFLEEGKPVILDIKKVEE